MHAPPLIASNEIRTPRRRSGFTPLFQGALGLGAFFTLWYLLVDKFGVWRFRQLPGLGSSFRELFSTDPTYGVSLFTSDYYRHLSASAERVAEAFFLAVVFGIVVGLGCGWSRVFRAIVFPLLEIARPIPVLAWIPVVILVSPNREASVVTLTFLSGFFITTLNTMLGVRSIDEVYFRAARSLGFSEWAVLRHIIVPGALPFIFVGLQIAMAACWFSLVASEIVAGTAGLGYKLWEAYSYVQFETMVIMMGTLGVCGYVSSALVRRVGAWLMRWRSEQLRGVSS